MYKVKIENNINKTKNIIISNGEQMVDKNGQLMEEPATEMVDTIIQNEDGTSYMASIEKNLYDENNNIIMNPILNQSGKDKTVTVYKTQEEIDLEKLALVTAKKNEIQAKVDAYKAKQEYQRKHGGPGPVADVEIMQIVNEHNGQFEVVFKEE